jgi:Asp-tRNA(Asn)/Glu-tRNA(Gln) amidotransferase B subunit
MSTCFYTAQGEFLCDVNLPVNKKTVPKTIPEMIDQHQENFANPPAINVHNINSTGNISASGNLKATNQLCIGEVCVSKDQLRKLTNIPRDYWAPSS